MTWHYFRFHLVFKHRSRHSVADKWVPFKHRKNVLF